LKGQRRFQPPPGYLSSAEAIKRLGKTLYKYVEENRIRKLTPDGHKHGFYNEEDVNAILQAERTFSATKGRQCIPPRPCSVSPRWGIWTSYTNVLKVFQQSSIGRDTPGWMRKSHGGTTSSSVSMMGPWWPIYTC
jgi:hypothetical protein